MAERRTFTKVELLALELIIAVVKKKGASPSSVLKDDTDKAAQMADNLAARAEAWAARHGGFNKINDKGINSRIKSATDKLGPEPTLKQLMELHTEAVKNVK